ncbi:MAG: phosphotransferase [Candidatus Binatia bacterium]|nr:phosphotransferase [Candidatus Binatia bacterium]
MSNWTAILEGCFPGASVSSEQPLAGDASTRRYVRLHLSGGGAPQTAIGMVLPEKTAATAPELSFLNIQRHLEGRGIGVPAVYGARDRDLGLLLLEDVGDRPLALPLRDPTTSPDERRRLLGDVVALLAALAASAPDPGCVAYSRSHDEALLRRELDIVLSHGLAASDDGPTCSPGDHPEAKGALARLGDTLAAQPRRLMHRDFHAWNLHVDPDGRLRVIDFQDAMLGPPTYDLASLCTDRDSDELFSAADERELLDTYGTALARAGVDLYTDPTVLRRDYYTSVVFRTLRVIGRFRFLAIEKGNPGYLHYIPRMARQTRRALDELGDDGLARVLADRSAYFA